MRFVCDACRSGQHAGCPGGTWCDCQHRMNLRAGAFPLTLVFMLARRAWLTLVEPYLETMTAEEIAEAAARLQRGVIFVLVTEAAAAARRQGSRG